ncbi:uncharacterized protein At4g22758 [Prosopis cineraria]|uniref:uncharacterized protein At4g22758 n=1 Tax=Prosopis cineraria TaxID=364024 RepID=UPI00240FD8D1|nr:uncharacterized protein At4g22758 [Prosopis cineraria]
MPQRTIRHRAPATSGRRSKPPHHPFHSPNRRTPPRSSNKSKPLKILKRCSSAPLLLSDSSSIAADGDHDLDYDFRHESMLLRPQTFSAAFESSPSLLPSSPQNHEGFRKEAKVVVSVTVDGSPGPIRTMVKLGSSVDDTIKLVVNKYSDERRTPKIDPNASASFQLYDSHFSLQGLDKSELIGDVGSRSFYLRKSNNESPSGSFRLETVTDPSKQGSDPSKQPPTHNPMLFPCFKINKFVRRLCRIWKMVVCSK